MKHLPLFLLLLLAFRVCVVPIGYARYAYELQRANVNFEQIRVKNRRSSYLEEGVHISEAPISTSATFVSVWRFLCSAKKRIFAPFIIAIPTFKYHSTLLVMPRCLYLLNRAFRL